MSHYHPERSFRSLHHRIEQAIANEWSTDRICAELDVTPERVEEERAGMEAALGTVEPDEPATPPPPPPPVQRERVLRPHGTHAAFNRHRWHRTVPCDECRSAERVYQAERAVRRSRRNAA